jgi:hypothetical protein
VDGSAVGTVVGFEDDNGVGVSVAEELGLGDGTLVGCEEGADVG